MSAEVKGSVLSSSSRKLWLLEVEL